MRKANARERILNTASELFARDGYALVGINEIIAKSETAKASFYQHFPSKEILCAEWLKAMHERSEAHHQEIREAAGSAEQKIRDYFRDLREWLEENDYRGCPYTNTTAMLHTGAAVIREQVELHKLFIRDFFVALAEEIRPRDGEGLGSAMFLLYSGATAEAQNVRATWPVDAALSAVKRLMAGSGEAEEVDVALL